MAKGKKHLFKVRFRIAGKPKTYITTAKSGDEAARKIRSNGADVISVRKMPKR